MAQWLGQYCHHVAPSPTCCQSLPGRPQSPSQPHRWDGPSWGDPAPRKPRTSRTAKAPQRTNAGDPGASVVPAARGIPARLADAQCSLSQMASTGWPLGPVGRVPMKVGGGKGGLRGAQRRRDEQPEGSREFRQALGSEPTNALGSGGSQSEFSSLPEETPTTDWLQVRAGRASPQEALDHWGPDGKEL